MPTSFIFLIVFCNHEKLTFALIQPQHSDGLMILLFLFLYYSKGPHRFHTPCVGRFNGFSSRRPGYQDQTHSVPVYRRCSSTYAYNLPFVYTQSRYVHTAKCCLLAYHYILLFPVTELIPFKKFNSIETSYSQTFLLEAEAFKC